MATIKYECDTCRREIELLENSKGLTVFGKCVITLGCKGKLHKLSRNLDNVRSVFPPSVQGLDNYLQRRAFHQHIQTVSSNKWNITHNLGVSPAVVVYITDSVTGVSNEISPDSYVITVKDKNTVSIKFDSVLKGIVHLIARSSVPRDFGTSIALENSTQVSSNGLLTLAVPRLITTPNQIDLLNNPISVTIITTVPGRNPEESTVTLSSSLDDSPWIGWTEILIRKRRNFVLRTITLSDIDAFDEFDSVDLIPNGTSVQFTEINFGNGPEPIQSRQLFNLLSKSPFEPFDKIRSQIVDLGNLNVSRENKLVVFDGELVIDVSNVENIYPYIEQKISSTLFNHITPTITPTISVTPTGTPTVTPTPTPSATP